MANQRMFIQCMSCGAEKMLAKRLGGAFHTVSPGTDWDVWFKKHEWGFCGDKVTGQDIFKLVYEHPPEMERK